MTLKLTVSETADGKQQYLQILSGDTLSVNIVLVAQKIEIADRREGKK